MSTLLRLASQHAPRLVSASRELISSEAAMAALGRRVVFFGMAPHRTACPARIAGLLELTGCCPQVSLCLEQFLLDQQPSIDEYMDTGVPNDALTMGGDGFSWGHYGKLLELARELGNVKVFGGFPPRAGAVRASVKEGESAGVKQAVEQGLLGSEDEYVPGSPKHYRLFESLITQRGLDQEPTGEFERLFPAQCLKDSVMARIVWQRVIAGDAVLCVTGLGHTGACLLMCARPNEAWDADYGFGVPERVLKRANDVLGRCEICIVTCAAPDEERDQAFDGRDIADLVLLYE